MPTKSGPGENYSINPTVNAQIVGMGQSWINLWETGSFYSAVFEILQANGVANTFQNLMGYGGSAILEAHNRDDVANWYWAATPSASYPGTWTDGPLLTSGIAAINTDIGKGPTPTCLVWYQKQQDSVELDMSTPAAARAEAMLWRFGTHFVMNKIAAEWNPGNPGGVTKFVDVEGRRNSGGADRIAVMRDATMDLLSTLGPVVLFGMEAYDLPLPSNDDHPAPGDTYQMGLRTGIAIANEHFGGTYAQGATISSITRGASNIIDIAINVEAGQTLRKPTLPVGFAVFTGSDFLTGARVTVTGYSWIGNTLRLTLASTGQVTVCYPWLDAGDLDYTPGGTENSIIRYSTKINSRDIGLPLRSIKSTTVA